MKKKPLTLVIKILILGIPLYAIMIFTYLYPMAFMPIEYSMWQQEKDYVRGNINAVSSDDSAKEANADILIVGDSRAKSGIIPELLSEDKNVYNIAIGGSTPVEMYYALSHYLENHQKPETVIITFAPYHFCYLDNWGQTLANNYLSADELAEVYATAIAHNELDAFGDEGIVDALSYKLRLPNKYLTSIYNAGFIGRKNDNEQKYLSVSLDKGYTEFGTDRGCDKPNYDTHFDWFDDLKFVDLYLEKIVDLCEVNDIRVINIMTPMNEASRDVMYPKYQSGYNRILRSIIEKYPDNVCETEFIYYDNIYFGDENHMNRDGAERFTLELSQRMFSE